MSENLNSIMGIFQLPEQKVLFVVVIIVSLTSISCAKKKDTSKGDAVISSIVLDDDIKDTVDADLYKFARDISIIHLEDKPGITVGNIYSISEGDGYIFVGTEKRYYIFDKNGSFIKEPFIQGRGPDEVLNPLFFSQIKDNKLWFNESNRPHFIESYDILTDKWRPYNIPAWADGISELIVDEDSTVTFINRLLNLIRPVTIDFTFVKQKLNGEILDSIFLGQSSSEYGLSYDLLKYREGGMLAMNPGGDSVTHFRQDGDTVVWRNFYAKRKTGYSGNRTFVRANLLFYSSDTVIFSRSRFTSNNKKRVGSDMVIIDRTNGNVAILRLYLKDHSLMIVPERMVLSGDNRFYFWLSSYEILKLAEKDNSLWPLFRNYEISYDSNPILFFGEFS